MFDYKFNWIYSTFLIISMNRLNYMSITKQLYWVFMLWTYCWSWLTYTFLHTWINGKTRYTTVRTRRIIETEEKLITLHTQSQLNINKVLFDSSFIYFIKPKLCSIYLGKGSKSQRRFHKMTSRSRNITFILLNENS